MRFGSSVILAMLIAVPCWPWNETDIGGQIIDKSGAPVASAAIQVVSPPDKILFNANADRDGRFVLKRVPDGRYQVRVAARGFTSVSIPIHVVRGKAPPLGIIKLEVSCSNPGVICDAVTPK